MVQHILGEETFKKGLFKYLSGNKYSNVDHEDLWEALTIQAHEDNVLDVNFTLKEIMDTWTLQPGFPVLSVNRNSNNVTVSQVRFYVFLYSIVVYFSKQSRYPQISIILANRELVT